MRLSRHAKNRLRWIKRISPDIDEPKLLEAILGAKIQRLDMKGNALYALVVSGVPLLVVVDEGEEVVVTIWVEE